MRNRKVVDDLMSLNYEDAIEETCGFGFGTPEYMQIKRAYSREHRKRYCKPGGVPPNKNTSVLWKRNPGLTIEAIAKKYAEGAFLDRLAIEYKVSTLTLRRVLVRHGVTIDGNRRAIKPANARSRKIVSWKVYRYSQDYGHD